MVLVRVVVPPLMNCVDVPPPPGACVKVDWVDWVVPLLVVVELTPDVVDELVELELLEDEVVDEPEVVDFLTCASFKIGFTVRAQLETH